MNRINLNKSLDAPLCYGHPSGSTRNGLEANEAKKPDLFLNTSPRHRNSRIVGTSVPRKVGENSDPLSTKKNKQKSWLKARAPDQLDERQRPLKNKLLMDTRSDLLSNIRKKNLGKFGKLHLPHRCIGFSLCKLGHLLVAAVAMWPWPGINPSDKMISTSFQELYANGVMEMNSCRDDVV